MNFTKQNCDFISKTPISQHNVVIIKHKVSVQMCNFAKENLNGKMLQNLRQNIANVAVKMDIVLISCQFVLIT